MSHDESMDFNRIQETSDGDREFETELFNMFLDDTAERIEALDAAIADGDAESCHRQAHTIKGSAANVGATRLCEISLQLESFDPKADKAEAESCLARMKSEFENTKAAIQDYLA